MEKLFAKIKWLVYFYFTGRYDLWLPPPHKTMKNGHCDLDVNPTKSKHPKSYKIELNNLKLII